MHGAQRVQSLTASAAQALLTQSCDEQAQAALDSGIVAGTHRTGGDDRGVFRACVAVCVQELKRCISSD